MQNQDQLILNVQHLEKRFGENLVLRDIDFQVRPGQVTSIICSSGSGKSTLLRCLNLIEELNDGYNLYNRRSILNWKKMNINKYRTQVGMVFQSFNLFKNCTVLENCTVGQRKILGRSQAEAEAV